MWVVPSKEDLARDWMRYYDVEIIDRISWIKMNKEGLVVNSLGFHFLRCKEDIIIGRVGNFKKVVKKTNFGKDVIFGRRRKQSQKPIELYDLIENNLLSGVKCVEVFGRDHNLRKNWVTLGDQLSIGDNVEFMKNVLSN